MTALNLDALKLRVNKMVKEVVEVRQALKVAYETNCTGDGRLTDEDSIEQQRSNLVKLQAALSCNRDMLRRLSVKVCQPKPVPNVVSKEMLLNTDEGVEAKNRDTVKPIDANDRRSTRPQLREDNQSIAKDNILIHDEEDNGSCPVKIESYDMIFEPLDTSRSEYACASPDKAALVDDPLDNDDFTIKVEPVDVADVDFVTSTDVNTDSVQDCTDNQDYPAEDQNINDETNAKPAARPRKVRKKCNVEECFCCPCCTESFTNRYKFEDHLWFTHGRKSSICDACGKSFRRRKDLGTHLVLHTRFKPYVCDICGMGFNQCTSLRNHRMAHFDMYPYNCDMCAKKFKLLNLLCTHLRVHIGTKPYKCDICTEKFGRANHLHRHIMAKHTVIPKVELCDICGKRFRQLEGLRQHRQIHLDLKPFHCDLCEKQFKISKQLRIHIATVHLKKPYVCRICFANYGCALHIKQHMIIRRHRFEHQNSSQGQKPENRDTVKPVVANDRRLSRPQLGEDNQSFAKDVRDEEDNKSCPVKIESCDMIFEPLDTSRSEYACASPDKAALVDDPLDNDDFTIKVEPVDVADVDFVTSTDVNTDSVQACTDNQDYPAKDHHINDEPNAKSASMQSTVKKIFRCPNCAESFTRYQLDNHIWLMHGRKSFVCDVCGKRTKRKDDLAKHLVLHTTYKPNVCDVCGLGFSQCSGLRNHRMTHFDMYPYNCDLCAKKFKLSNALYTHLHVHIATKPYKCDICTEKFRRANHLHRHIMAKHSYSDSVRYLWQKIRKKR